MGDSLREVGKVSNKVDRAGPAEGETCLGRIGPRRGGALWLWLAGVPGSRLPQNHQSAARRPSAYPFRSPQTGPRARPPATTGMQTKNSAAKRAVPSDERTALKRAAVRRPIARRRSCSLRAHASQIFLAAFRSRIIDRGSSAIL